MRRYQSPPFFSVMHSFFLLSIMLLGFVFQVSPVFASPSDTVYLDSSGGVGFDHTYTRAFGVKVHVSLQRTSPSLQAYSAHAYVDVRVAACFEPYVFAYFLGRLWVTPKVSDQIIGQDKAMAKITQVTDRILSQTRWRRAKHFSAFPRYLATARHRKKTEYRNPLRQAALKPNTRKTRATSRTLLHPPGKFSHRPTRSLA